MIRVVLGVLLLLLAPVPASAQPEVTIPQGMLAGTLDNGITSFKGIPFAAPPVGSLRWRAPQPASAWPGVRDASTFGAICPQAKLSLMARLKPHVKLPESEDCLTLNVWTPDARPAAKLPVMVWIYGGYFRSGGAARPVYDGVQLASHGVIVVTLNYRLGWLGFLDLPALAAEHPDEPTGNFGLLDQIAALRWVQNNIASFGGDPANVTIFGESAGGMSVNDLMASPLARGLFAKAISESGLGLNTIPTAALAQQAGLAFASKEGANGANVADLAKLRDVSADSIIDAQEGSDPAPMVDGKVLTEQVYATFAAGKMAHVPYIAGSNSNEATLMPSTHMTADDLEKPLGDKLPAVRKIYEPDGALSDEEFVHQLFGDALFTAAAQGLASFEAMQGSPAYVYRFGYVAERLRIISSGVGHGGEVPFVFGLSGLGREPGMGTLVSMATPKDQNIVALMQGYWTNFAKTGNPNGPGLPQWNSLTPSLSQTLVVDDAPKLVLGFRKGQIAVIYAGWSKRTGLQAPN
ncbi:MAG: carboxylesterase family protein [Rhizomicrobium sp.]|jgi:para-nitrobenzyl esterase